MCWPAPRCSSSDFCTAKGVHFRKGGARLFDFPILLAARLVVQHPLRHQPVEELDEGSQAEGTDQRTDAHKAAQQPAQQRTQRIGEHAAAEVRHRGVVPQAQREVIVRGDAQICRLVQRSPQRRDWHRQRHPQLPNVGWCEVTDMLFKNNAKIGEKYFPDTLGVLKAGAAADIIVMDYKPFTPFSDENIDGHMIFGMTGRQCQTTIAAGKTLMLDRQLVGIDEEAENAHILEASKKLWGDLNHRTY